MPKIVPILITFDIDPLRRGERIRYGIPQGVRFEGYSHLTTHTFITAIQIENP
jgi:hypothetical protein